MRAIGLLAALMAVTTQGCASALTSMGTPYGTNFGEIKSDRPGVADALKGGQTMITGFGKPAHMSVPQDIPLPKQANPRAMFTVPNLDHRTLNAVFNTMAAVVMTGCALMPDFNQSRDRTCESDAERKAEKNITLPAPQRGPVILR